MYNGYRTIFWGILFASFHIKLGPIPILPLFIAWAIVSSGINKLLIEETTEDFTKAKAYTTFMIILSLIAFIISLYWQNAGNNILYTIAYPVIFGIFELLTEYKILTGSIENLKKDNKGEVAKEFQGMTRSYIVMFLIFLVMECVSLCFIMSGFLTITGIFGLILRIYYMSMMSRLMNLYKVDGNNLNIE